MYSLIKLKIQIAGCQCDSDFTQNELQCVAKMKTNIVKYLVNPQMLLNTVIL